MNKARPKNQSDTDMPKITMRDVLAPLFRHRRIVILTFCMVAILGTLVAWLWAPHYHVAQMQILVEQNRSDPTVTSAQNSTVANSKLVTTYQNCVGNGVVAGPRYAPDRRDDVRFGG